MNEKEIKKLLMIKEEEPFESYLNKEIYINNHFLETIYLNDKIWSLETKNYSEIPPITKYIYRWIFNKDLPFNILKKIPSNLVELAKTHMVILHPEDKLIMPTMGGIVNTILASDKITNLYQIEDPIIL